MLDGFASLYHPQFESQLLQATLPELRLVDVGFNSMDKSFRGNYHGKHCHPSDLGSVLRRAGSLGVESMLCTASSTKESKQTFQFAREYQGKPCKLQCTVGVHPTRCNEFQHGVEPVIAELRRLIDEGTSEGLVAAIGECGLDYDRLFLCPKELQHIGFVAQLELAKDYDLPLFLHDRNTGGDFLRVLRTHIDHLPAKGVVHSFTGTIEEMRSYCDIGMYISVNGCSMRTEEGLAMVAAVPEHLLLLETDAPWCELKSTHASNALVSTRFPAVKKEKFLDGAMIKGRNEPCAMIQVLEVAAKVRDVDPLELANVVAENTYRLFPTLALG